MSNEDPGTRRKTTKKNGGQAELDMDKAFEEEAEIKLRPWKTKSTVISDRKIIIPEQR